MQRLSPTACTGPAGCVPHRTVLLGLAGCWLALQPCTRPVEMQHLKFKQGGMARPPALYQAPPDAAVPVHVRPAAGCQRGAVWPQLGTADVVAVAPQVHPAAPPMPPVVLHLCSLNRDGGMQSVGSRMLSNGPSRWEAKGGQVSGPTGRALHRKDWRRGGGTQVGGGQAWHVALPSQAPCAGWPPDSAPALSL